MPISDPVDPKVLAILVEDVGVVELWWKYHELVVLRMDLVLHAGRHVGSCDQELELRMVHRSAVEAVGSCNGCRGMVLELHKMDYAEVEERRNLADPGMEILEVVDHSMSCYVMAVDHSSVVEVGKSDRRGLERRGH